MLYKHKQLPDNYVNLLDSDEDSVRYVSLNDNNLSILGKKYFYERFEPLIPLNYIENLLKSHKKYAIQTLFAGCMSMNVLYGIISYAADRSYLGVLLISCAAAIISWMAVWQTKNKLDSSIEA